MEKKSNRNSLLARLASSMFASWTTVASVAVAAVAVVLTLAYLGRDTSASLGSDEKIDPTPTLVTSMKSIGQWEFMAIADEEIVDTVRHGFFSDDELVRIYYGTLRIGIDMKEAHEGWLYMDGDTLRAILPQVRLLDANFIDEARTRSFIETGKWTHQDRKAMYERAVRRMKRRCLTPQNYEAARENARRQFEQMLRGMGFERVAVGF